MSDANVAAEPTYRQANVNDAASIAHVIEVAMREPNPVGFDHPLTNDEVRTWLSRLGGEGGVFLAIIDGNVVGFATGTVVIGEEAEMLERLGLHALSAQRLDERPAVIRLGAGHRDDALPCVDGGGGIGPVGQAAQALERGGLLA